MPVEDWNPTIPDSQDELGQNLPYSLEAEQSVLGAALLDWDNAMPVVADMLPRPDYFYTADNRMIYSAMLQMFMLNQPMDVVTLLEKLREDPRFEEDTGKPYLLRLAQTVPVLSRVGRYAEIVRDKYDVRRLMDAARGILSQAADGSASPSQLLDMAEQRIYEIREGKDAKGLRHIGQVILETFDRLDHLASADADRYRGIATGIGQLDRIITGLNRSDLIVLAARPGVGKTSFGLNIARHAAVEGKRRVAFFSLEMSREQLASRLLSSTARVEGTALRSGQLNQGDWTRIIEAGDVLGKMELYLDDTPDIGVQEMKSRVRRLGKVDLVIVDYLQLMHGSGRHSDNRVQEVTEITRNLKIMAKELDLPVIAMSQLRRPTERTKDHRPGLSELRDSGSIEQDADVVIFLHRAAYTMESEGGVPDEDMDANAAEIIVAKNRHGSTESIPVHWEGQYMTFTGVDSFHHG